MPLIASFAKDDAPLREPEVIYVTAVLPMMENPAYAQALRSVKKRHPFGAILSAKAVWPNRESWLATQRHIMAIATHVYVLPFCDRTIGFGLYCELLHAIELNPAPSLFAVTRGGVEEIREIETLQNVHPVRCARLITDESIAEEEAQKAAAAAAQIPVAKKSAAKKRQAALARKS
jgi:hypothetical protein